MSENIDSSGKRWKMKKIIILCVFFLSASKIYAVEKHVVAGAGPSTKIVEDFFNQYQKSNPGSGLSFVVPPRSVKHAGGIKAAEKNVFGRTGRPLNEKEKSKNKSEIFLAGLPIVMVKGSKVELKKISLSQLESIIQGKIKNWKDVGGSDNPIYLIGREPTEAAFTIIKSKYSFFKNAKFDKILKKDHQVKNAIEHSKGDYGLGFGVKSNFEDSQVIEVTGFELGVNVGLVYDKKNKSHPLVLKVQKFSDSKNWHEYIESLGFLPVK